MAGQTVLTFELIDKKYGRPFYHFAFNIPENKIEKAYEWQKIKTDIIHPNPDFNWDSTKKIVHFSGWNANSIFFLDPAGNLLEYIARHDLKNANAAEFSAKDILYAGDI